MAVNRPISSYFIRIPYRREMPPLEYIVPLSTFVATLAVLLVGFIYNNSRISDLRSDMNQRFQDMNQSFNQRFEDMNQSFNQRFHRHQSALCRHEPAA